MNSLQFVGLVLAIAVVFVIGLFVLVRFVSNHVKGSDVTNWGDETR